MRAADFAAHLFYIAENMREKFCFFTGHRVLPAGKRGIIEDILKKHIAELAARGVTTFIAGGALGFDMLAAKAGLDMRGCIAADI